MYFLFLEFVFKQMSCLLTVVSFYISILSKNIL
jgi:hypothetical protein